MSLKSLVESYATRAGAEAKALRTLINGNAPNLNALTTTTKTNLVAALNEVHAAVGGSISVDDLADVSIGTPSAGEFLGYNGSEWVDSALPDATTSTKGVGELADNTEALAGVSTSLLMTPATTKALIDALVDAAPGTLDTLNELAAALGDDPDFAGTITTALAGKQATHANLSALVGLTLAANKGIYSTGAGALALFDLTAAARGLLDDASVTDMRTTLSVYSKTEIGDIDTADFVATFEAALV